ncbi:hypothetical protein I7I48_11205 [Histoplasma ohiense]|nr:hypothetical protein I7I48_11205 [Histoplasma ohiense (nom. inval.)]
MESVDIRCRGGIEVFKHQEGKQALSTPKSSQIHKKIDSFFISINWQIAVSLVHLKSFIILLLRP